MVCRETLLPGMVFGGGKSQLIGKDPDSGKEKVGGGGDNRR